MASDLDKACLTRASIWVFRVTTSGGKDCHASGCAGLSQGPLAGTAVVILGHAVTGVNSKAKQVDMFLSAFVAGLSKHVLKDSEVAPPRSLPKAVQEIAQGYVWLLLPEEIFQLQHCGA